MRKILILFFAILICPSLYPQEKPADFAYYDSITFRMYEDGKWKALARAGKDALDAGYDYYYMRMRTGIALFRMKDYLAAVKHFNKAEEMNPLSHDPAIFTYYCYAATEQWLPAREALSRLPVSIRDTILQIPSHTLYLEGGYMQSTAADEVPQNDLDGRMGIFGEAYLPEWDQYYSAGYKYSGGRRLSLHLAATTLQGNWWHRAMSGNRIILHENIDLDQYEGYIAAKVYLGKGLYVVPAWHFIALDYNYTRIQFEPGFNRYDFIPEKASFRDHIALLGFEKSTGKVNLSLSGGYSTIFSSEQYQASAGLTWFPLGNMNLYTDTRLFNHTNDRESEWVFSQEVGFRISDFLWMELRGIFGRMENFYDRSGYTVYNTGYPMDLLGKATLHFLLGKNIIFMLDYRVSMAEGSWTRYRIGPGPLPPEPVTETINFRDHYFSGGIKWSF